ncbi:MAG: serine hydrolase [Ornithinimicrobium sp.]
MNDQTPQTETAEITPAGWSDVETAGALLPQSQPLVTIDNWQEWPTLHRSFQHMREVMPSHIIGAGAPTHLPAAHTDLSAVRIDKHEIDTVGDLLENTHTNGFLVMHRGQVLTECYPGGMEPTQKHLVMSMSKSIVSCVTATLVRDGVLLPDKEASRYVPELAHSGFAGATVRDLLDMRSGIRFRETYLDPESEVRVMERSMGWAPRREEDPVGMYPFILTCEQERPHGDKFEYRSIETDVLGWVCERATGTRMADLVAERVWRPIGAEHDAEFSVDPLGSAIHDGGISATLRDLARFGHMLLNDGKVGEHDVAPAWWFEDTVNPPADVRDTFAASDNEPYLPGGWYRNQFWCIPGDNGPIMMALGIHGQMTFIEQSSQLVGVKLSTWPTPQDASKLLPTIDGFRAIGRAVKSTD